ncbi:MAG: endolytic transglycosylase MltG [Paludibacteraceae bacterium]|nr:endolytic transglycosylase MltG [Paludibacteraceae bacterium]
MSTLKKTIWITAGVLVSILAVVGFIYYRTMLSPNVVVKGEPKYLLVYEEDTFDDVVKHLKKLGAMKDMDSFIRTAKRNGYPEQICPGRYKLEDGMSNYLLVHRLINNRQAPLSITFNNIRTKKQLAQRLSEQLMMKEADLLDLLNDPVALSEFGVSPESSVALFIPNSYEVYWTVTPNDLLCRMKKEYDKFWTKERMNKLAEVGISQLEVSTLASIVEEETNKLEERPMVAGLYLNRLRKGMKLQADPTVKFALGNFALRRLLSGHLSVNSPYNTYQNFGLPPGPIRIPSMNAIDAVLNYARHDYLFMCAKSDRSGYHDFTVTFDEHKGNATKYRKSLDERNIH